MKVKIGPYPKGTKERKIDIKIDDYDVWSMDHTLAMIIVPMLKKIQEQKHGAPFVDDADVIDELKSTSAPPKENDWDTDDNWFKRWDWVISEMLWSFEQVVDFYSEDQFFNHDNVDVNADLNQRVHQILYDEEGHKLHIKRIENGIRLFGKYYRSLWT